jgi:mono/diheme cytochrome c family protein
MQTGRGNWSETFNAQYLCVRTMGCIREGGNWGMRRDLGRPFSAAMLMVAVLGGSVAVAAPKKATKPAAKHAAAAKKGTAKPGGDTAAGKKLVTSSGCTGCHKIDGKGGTSGPDLSHEGAKHDAAWIAKKLKDPKSTNPNSIMPKFNGPEKDVASLAAYLTSLK